MPIYPYRCNDCGAEFEVSRSIARMGDPAACPACGVDARRVFTPLAVTGRAVDPASVKGKAQPPKSGGWSHGGHSHGASEAGHSHGLWDRPASGA